MEILLALGASKAATVLRGFRWLPPRVNAGRIFDVALPVSRHPNAS